MRDFDYIAPKSVEETIKILSEYKDDAKIIAGGQSLLNILKQDLMAPEILVDIKNLSELDYITYDEKEGMKIGATTTHHSVETSPLILEHYPLIAEMEHTLAFPQTRNWGTIGGNLCIQDPTGDVAPILIALKATVKIVGPNGERTLPMEDFSIDYYETALEEDEILTEIQIPPVAPKTGIAYSKFRIVEGDAPIVGACVAFTLNEDGTCADARVATNGTAPIPLRIPDAEAVFKGKKITDELITEAVEIAGEAMECIPDIVASDEYKKRVAKVYIKRMARKALSQIQ